ncbi:hypothetical protein CHLNCDRAFT_133222 [Chlorella variabilis]|uniref:EGF-like domain-containing protein n=1 Tax=Chlorella variabilis TaxID=554065 RepID=E1Z2M6_CHLVA|nr:hypothetical protein CHLNCDRAFT_133222 [Chlorella variabilis]EFN60026.1 hypothetical protein CHLNCDRAFT_133222 [Chlorella variabilis]|eukprot:XP_005852128.1 hypothetical protein CHLNCDRAFT_133222 [Chlorella variabilis]
MRVLVAALLLLLACAAGSAAAAGCIPGKGWCAFCNLDLTRCGKCINGFSPNSAGACRKCTPHCITCRHSHLASTCLQCADGYTIVKGKCVACKDKHCVTCRSGPKKCDWCGLTGYRFDNKTGGCKPCTTKNCAGCVLAQKAKKPFEICFACKYGYQAVWYKSASANCVTPCKIKNCAAGRCYSDHGCEVCRDGYYQTLTGTCKRCLVPHCQTCASPDTCQECAPGYIFGSGRRAGTCIKVTGPGHFVPGPQATDRAVIIHDMEAAAAAAASVVEGV